MEHDNNLLSKKVVILMPVYNGEKYLKESIESILNQSFYDFCLLIINDGSTDNSEKIINSFLDSRIIYLKNEINLGLIKTLNKGLDLIKGRYIVRMDQDDIAFYNRISTQVKYMDKHVDVVVSGTSALIIDENNKIVSKFKVNTQDSKINTGLIFFSELIHPTVILRNEIIKKYNFKYNDLNHACEDYGLWQLISNKYIITNISKPLLKYRKTDFGMTSIADKNETKRDYYLMGIYKQMFIKLKIDVSNDELLLYRKFISGSFLKNKYNFIDIEIILTNIYYAISYDKKYNLYYFNKIIHSKIRENAFNANYTIFEYIALFKINENKIVKFDLLNLLKFIFKKYMIHFF